MIRLTGIGYVRGERGCGIVRRYHGSRVGYRGSFRLSGVRDVGIGSRWRFEGIYQDSPCLSVDSRLKADHSPMEARRGRDP